MKNRTALDLIALMDKISAHHDKRHGSLEKLSSALARYGLRACMSGAFNSRVPQHETDRLTLLVQWYRAPQNEQALLDLLDELDRLRAIKSRRLGRIRDIQIARGISGIEVEEGRLGGETLSYPGRCVDLEWIESDLPKLREWKDAIAQFFIRQSEKAGYRFYRIEEDGETSDEVSPTEILMSVAAMGDWCYVWDSNESPYRTSSGRHYSLVLGSGLYPEGIGAEIVEWTSTDGDPTPWV